MILFQIKKMQNKNVQDECPTRLLQKLCHGLGYPSPVYKCIEICRTEVKRAKVELHVFGTSKVWVGFGLNGLEARAAAASEAIPTFLNQPIKLTRKERRKRREKLLAEQGKANVKLSKRIIGGRRRRRTIMMEVDGRWTSGGNVWTSGGNVWTNDGTCGRAAGT